MLKDLTLKITPEMAKTAQGNEKKAFSGHLGTHFDVMNKEFPIEYFRRKAVIFDVSKANDRDIGPEDIDLEKARKDMFIGFYSGWIEEKEYGTKDYFSMHPQLSKELIDMLLEKGISLIGIDFAGVRRGKEHTLTDQYCADHGVFIIENLCNMKEAVGECDIYTLPLNYTGMSGFPCRVVAEMEGQ